MAITKIKVGDAIYPIKAIKETTVVAGDNISIVDGPNEHEKIIKALINTVTPGRHIRINNGVISFTGYDLIAGKNITINSNTISKVDTIGVQIIYTDQLPTENIQTYPFIYAVLDEVEYDTYVLWEFYQGRWIQYESVLNPDNSGFKLNTVSNVDTIIRSGQVSFKWTDPDDYIVDGVTFAHWRRTIVVRKEGSPPTHPTDGIIVCNEITKNLYSTTHFTDAGLVNNNIYYYGIFPGTTNNAYNMGTIILVSPGDVFPSVASNIIITPNREKMNVVVNWHLPDDADRAIIYFGDSKVSDLHYDIKSNEITNADGGYLFSGLQLDRDYYFRIYTYNSQNRSTASNIFNIHLSSWNLVTFADGTDAQLKEMLDAHYAGDIDIADYWSVGDTRIINYNGGTLSVTITGIKVNDLTTVINGHTKAAITIQSTNILENNYINLISGNLSANNVWSNIGIRTWLNQIFLNNLSESFSSLIKNVNNQCLTSHDSNNTALVSDTIFLPSITEIYGTGNEGVQWEYYNTLSNRYKQFNNNNAIHWTRTPLSNYDDSKGYAWATVEESGELGNHYGDERHGIAPAFAM